jgi:hypothetical protein
MDTFAETAIIDYRLLFADQGKQTSVFRLKKKKTEVCRFRLQQTKGSCHFPLILFSKYIYIETAAYIYR